MTAQARLLGGRYQVGELLGYGGMAEVHRGRDLRLGRDVAIKMLRTDLARDATFQMRFRREAQNAASLNHPAIVAVYDTGEETAPTGETLPFIVMEFVNGRTLKEVLGAEGRLQPRRALEIIADICAALEFSHRHGIIHRDIKPGNVMLTQTGQVKVMDFGIARALASGATTMTQTSAVIGTAQYLSPEQARGEAVDARSDVYAAGCVLFELLCGHPPFVGDSPVSVAYQHVREDPPAPSDINRGRHRRTSTRSCSRRWRRTRSTATRAPARCGPTCCAPPPAGRCMATPVMREAETMAMAPAGGAGGYPASGRGPQTRQIPARVGDPPQRKASSWLIAVFSALGVLAVIALVAGPALEQQRGQRPDTSVPSPDRQDPGRGDRRDPASRPVRRRSVTRSWPATARRARSSSRTRRRTTGEAEPARSPFSSAAASPRCACPTGLKGSKRESAEARLTEAKLKYDVKRSTATRAEDEVLEVDPPRARGRRGHEGHAQVSKGNVREVPNVVGLSQEEATRGSGTPASRSTCRTGRRCPPTRPARSPTRTRRRHEAETGRPGDHRRSHAADEPGRPTADRRRTSTDPARRRRRRRSACRPHRCASARP